MSPDYTAPTPEEILNDPAASNWLKEAIRGALLRDPVKACNEAAVLSNVLQAHAREILNREIERVGLPMKPLE